MKYKNITILGTSHIAKQSLKEIKEAFEKKPEIVALELDPPRLTNLLTNTKPSLKPSAIRQLGVLGYLFGLIGSVVQSKLGNLVGVEPGKEMVIAFKEAKKTNSEVYLIDQDIRITLRKLSKEVPFSEKMKLLWEMINGPFTKEKVKIDLNKVPEKELINKLVKHFKEKFPHMYKVLIKDRNTILANNIIGIAKLNPDKEILVVIGAGHSDILKTIKKKI